MCNLSWTPHSNLEKDNSLNHSYVSPKMGWNVFLLYINDLETHVPLFKYVDDSTLFEICNTNEISEIQESIDKAADWTSMNCMKINSKKSWDDNKFYTYDVNFKKSVPNIIIEGIPVEVVTRAKLLGVILSDDLTWNMHVDQWRLDALGGP